MMELLGPMATTALQGVAPKRIEEIDRPENEHLRLAKVNSCFAYSDKREIVARLWPHLAKPGAPDNTDAGIANPTNKTV